MISLSVCLSVCVPVLEHYLKRNQMSQLHHVQDILPVHGCGSVLLWQHWITLCTSGYVDDVTCHYNDCIVVHRLTSLLCGIGCVRSLIMAGAKTRRALLAGVVEGESAMHHCVLVQAIIFHQIQLQCS